MKNIITLNKKKPRIAAVYYHSYRAIKKRKNATDIVQRSHVSYVTIVCSELLAHTATD